MKQGSLIRSIVEQFAVHRQLRKRTTPNKETRGLNLVSAKRGCVIPARSHFQFIMTRTFVLLVLGTKRVSTNSSGVYSDVVYLS